MLATNRTSMLYALLTPITNYITTQPTTAPCWASIRMTVEKSGEDMVSVHLGGRS
jgi:hypothetical protein